MRYRTTIGYRGGEGAAAESVTNEIRRGAGSDVRYLALLKWSKLDRVENIAGRVCKNVALHCDDQ